MAEKRVARVSDIAATMGVQMPTVTGALKHLAEHSLVNYEPYQFVTLTPEGAAIAESMVRRHDVLRKFITEVLALPDEIADRDACGMEHALSDETLGRLIEFLRFIEECPHSGNRLAESFHRFRLAADAPNEDEPDNDGGGQEHTSGSPPGRA